MACEGFQVPLENPKEWKLDHLNTISLKPYHYCILTLKEGKVNFVFFKKNVLNIISQRYGNLKTLTRFSYQGMIPLSLKSTVIEIDIFKSI